MNKSRISQASKRKPAAKAIPLTNSNTNIRTKTQGIEPYKNQTIIIGIDQGVRNTEIKQLQAIKRTYQFEHELHRSSRISNKE